MFAGMSIAGRKGGSKTRRVLIDGFPERSLEVDALLIDNVQENLKIAIALATGQVSVWDEYYEIAGNLTRTSFIGKIRVTEPLFPDKRDDELVLVRKVKKNLGPDATLLQYLINRVLGRPAEQPLEGLTDDDYNMIIDMGSALELPENSLEGMDIKPSVFTPLTALPENLPNSSIKVAEEKHAVNE